MATSNQVTLRWRTAEPTASVVEFGTRLHQWDRAERVAGRTREHIVSLHPLAPGTRYYYRVGDGSTWLAPGQVGQSFTTYPVAETRDPIRVWVMGDSGTGNRNARAVRDAYLRYTAFRPTTVWLMLGDNAYPAGTDEQYQQAVFGLYASELRRLAVWPALGNHDLRSANALTQTGPYFDAFTLPTQGEAGGVASGTEAYYAFDCGPVHFVCLNTGTGPLSPQDPMLAWLQGDLAATRAPWIIAYFHHPPYSKGGHDSDARPDRHGDLPGVRKHVVPVLEHGGVDLVLSGHSHSYERSALLHGHLGPASTLAPAMVLDGGDGRRTGDGAYRQRNLGGSRPVGTVYAVVGSSGKTSGGALDHPVMKTSLNQLGSLVLEIDRHRLEAFFFDDKAMVRDAFSLEK